MSGRSKTGKPTKRARKLLVAGRVLQLYTAGGYEAVVAKFGVPHHPLTKSKMNARQLLDWATEVFLSDEAKQIGAARVVEELGRIAYADPRALFDDQGRLKAISDLDEDAARAIASVEVVTKTLPAGKGEAVVIEHTHKIKPWDKGSALGRLAQVYGMLIEKYEHSGEVKFTKIERIIVDPANPNG